jgi:hypothetical protein
VSSMPCSADPRAASLAALLALAAGCATTWKAPPQPPPRRAHICATRGGAGFVAIELGVIASALTAKDRGRKLAPLVESFREGALVEAIAEGEKSTWGQLRWCARPELVLELLPQGALAALAPALPARFEPRPWRLLADRHLEAGRIFEALAALDELAPGEAMEARVLAARLAARAPRIFSTPDAVWACDEQGAPLWSYELEDRASSSAIARVVSSSAGWVFIERTAKEGAWVAAIDDSGVERWATPILDSLGRGCLVEGACLLTPGRLFVSVPPSPTWGQRDAGRVFALDAVSGELLWVVEGWWTANLAVGGELEALEGGRLQIAPGVVVEQRSGRPILQ